RQDDSALVWRQSGGVDRLHAVLPDAAVGRLCLRPLRQHTAAGQGADRRARRTAAVVARVSANRGVAGLEARGKRAARAADSGPARLHGRAALLPALDDGAAAAGKLSPRDRPHALSAVLALERGFAARATQLSVRVRTAVYV